MAAVTLGGTDVPDSFQSTTTGQVFATSWTADQAFVLTHILFSATAAQAAGDVQPGVYSDTAGNPDALLGSGSIVNGVVINTNTLALTTPLSISNAQVVWCAVSCTGTNFNFRRIASASGAQRSHSDLSSSLLNPWAGAVSTRRFNIWGLGFSGGQTIRVSWAD
jgi:hypothetical protein